MFSEPSHLVGRLVGRLVGESRFVDQHARTHNGVQAPCCRCKKMVWLAPSSQKLRRDNPLLVIVCAVCVGRVVGSNLIGVVTGSALAELAQLRREWRERN